MHLAGGQVAMPTLNMIDARFNGTGPRLSRSSAGHRAFGCWSLAIIRAWTMADARCSEVVGWEMRHGQLKTPSYGVFRGFEITSCEKSRQVSGERVPSFPMIWISLTSHT